VSEKFRGSQVDIFATGGSMDRDSTQQYLLRLAGSGGLQVGASGLEVKSNGILSSMITAGAILGTHVGFDSSDVPDSSSYGGVGQKIEDALNAAYTDVQLRLKRDGTSPMTGALNMNGFAISGMADGVSQTDAVTLQQMQTYVSLGMRWLYPCAYAGVGLTHGCLRVNGKVRASQTVHMSTTVGLVGKVISFDGATITFSSTPGANQCVVSPGSIPTTMNNLVNAINSCTNLVTSKGVALNTVAYAIREETTGTTLHVVWEGDDATPTNANGLPCATDATTMLAFENIDPVTSGGRFFGAYDSVMDGGTIQGRRDNGVYMYDVDQSDWTLIFANPGSDFFTSSSADSGGTIASGLNGNLAIRGGTGIDTVSASASSPDPTPGVRVTINHGDLGTNTSQFHAEESVRLNTLYSDVGTAVGDHQNDFNAATASLLGDARRTALQNVMVNGTFIADPVGSQHQFDPGGITYPATSHTLACMPGWAIRDTAAAGGNVATVDLDTSGLPTPVRGSNTAKIDVQALGGSVPAVMFYQPIVGGEQFKAQKVTFRADVYVAGGSTGAKLFIEDSTMASPAYGAPHSGASAWETLYVNTTIAPTASWIRVGLYMDSTDVYNIDACNCVFGALYTSLQFMPKPEIEDYQLIASMYQDVNWWATLVNAGACGDYLTVPFGTSMISTPTITATPDAATYPGGITTMAAVEVTTPAGRGTTRHGTTIELNVSAGAAVQGDTVGGSIVADARPT